MLGQSSLGSVEISDSGLIGAWVTPSGLPSSQTQLLTTWRDLSLIIVQSWFVLINLQGMTWILVLFGLMQRGWVMKMSPTSLIKAGKEEGICVFLCEILRSTV
ncbi:hypothetical protein LINPERHAP2_LOCUS29948 [Linum perenne]